MEKFVSFICTTDKNNLSTSLLDFINKIEKMTTVELIYCSSFWNKDTIEKATGKYIFHLQNGLDVSNFNIEKMMESFQDNLDLVACKIKRKKEEPLFFADMFKNYPLNVVKISNNPTFILRGFLGVFIKRSKALEYFDSYCSIISEPVIISKILFETGTYGLSDIRITYDDSVKGFVNETQISTNQEFYTDIFDTYNKLLELSKINTDYKCYVEILVTTDIYFKLIMKNLPKNLEGKISIDEYLDNIHKILSNISDAVITTYIKNFVNNNLKYYVLMNLKYKKNPTVKCGLNQLLFVNDNKIVRSSNQSFVQLGYMSVAKNKLYLNGKYTTNIPLELFDFVLLVNNNLEIKINLIFNNDVHSLGKVMAHTYYFLVDTILPNDLNTIKFCMKVDRTFAPIDILYNKNSMADADVFYPNAQYNNVDKSYLNNTPKNKLIFSLTTPEQVEQYKLSIRSMINNEDRKIIKQNRAKIKISKLLFQKNIIVFVDKYTSASVVEQFIKKYPKHKIYSVSKNGDIMFDNTINISFTSPEYKKVYFTSKLHFNLSIMPVEFPFGSKQKFYSDLTNIVYSEV